MGKATIRPQAGDQIFVEGVGWVSRAIMATEKRRAVSPVTALTRKDGYASHQAGVVDSDGGIVEAHAGEGVRYKSIREYEGCGLRIEIWRPLNIPPDRLARICEYAVNMTGRPYGYGKIVTALLDAELCGGRTFFRHLTSGSVFPDCSVVWSEAFAAQGYDFGVASGAATPQEDLDFCRIEPRKFGLVKRMSTLEVGEVAL